MTTLETIPEEIFLSIFDCLGHSYKKDYLQYLTVSRRWQRAIERFFFQSFSLDNTQLSTFASLFRGTGAHRKALVKHISLEVKLPSYDGDNYHQDEELNNQIFSTAILELFQVLETFNEDEAVRRNFGRGGGLEFWMSTISSPDDDFENLDKVKKLRGTYIRLLSHEKLPILECVSKFLAVRHAYSRNLDPASGIIIASKLKDLRHCMTEYYDNYECISDEMRLKIRPEFTNALSNYTQSLEKFDLRSDYPLRINESTPPPKYISSSSLIDPMSIAIHEFIKRANVSVASISGNQTISPEILWPYENIEDAPVPLWPRLKELYIRAAPNTPDGDWYFTSNPKVAPHSEFIGPTGGNGSQKSHPIDETENMFRDIPVPERIEPLLKAMALVIRHAPSIRRLNLCFGEIDLVPKYVKAEGLKRQFDIYYSAPSESTRFSEELPLIRRPRILCDVLDWRPSEEIEKYWMEALGPNGAIYYHH